MKRAMVFPLMLAALIAELGAQQPSVPDPVLVEALREARKLLPQGVVALELEGFASPAVAKAVADSVGLIVKARNDLRICPRPPGCGADTVVAALSVTKVTVDRDVALVEIGTREAYQLTHIELFGALYEFSFRRERDGRWVCVSSKKVFES